MLADETAFAIIEPDDATRAIMRQGTRPGTGAGEIWRAIMQFKSFPIAYMQRVLGGRRWVRGDLQKGMRYGLRNLPGAVGDALTRDYGRTHGLCAQFSGLWLCVHDAQGSGQGAGAAQSGPQGNLAGRRDAVRRSGHFRGHPFRQGQPFRQQLRGNRGRAAGRAHRRRGHLGRPAWCAATLPMPERTRCAWPWATRPSSTSGTPAPLWTGCCSTMCGK